MSVPNPAESQVEYPVEATVVAEADYIVETASSIEKITPDEAFDAVPSLMNNVDETYFKLGGLFSVIQSNGWWKDKGYESFREFVEKRFGMHYRKAMYLQNIYVKLVESGIPWAKVTDLGWTKLKELVDVLNKDNVDDWVAKAKALSALQLADLVRESKKANPVLTSGLTPDSSTPNATTITFKVHPDQKAIIKEAVAKAKADAGSEFDAVGLEAIALNYVSGPKVSSGPKLTLREFIEQNGYSVEDVLQTASVIWPDVDIKATI